jgi:hypothetical protein
VWRRAGRRQVLRSQILVGWGRGDRGRRLAGPVTRRVPRPRCSLAATRASSFAVATLLSVTNLPGDTTGRHGSRRLLRAELEGRRLVPPPRLRGRTSLRGRVDHERRRTGPGARASPRRSARRGRNPGILLRTSVGRDTMYTAPRRSSSLGPAPLRSTSSASSLAPPVTPCARTVQKDQEQTEAEAETDRGRGRGRGRDRDRDRDRDQARRLGGVRPGAEAEGWTSRRARGGGPTARGTQRRRSSRQRRTQRSPGRWCEAGSMGGATEGPTDEGVTRRPGPLRRRSRSSVVTRRGTSTKARGWHEAASLELGAQRAAGPVPTGWAHPGGR